MVGNTNEYILKTLNGLDVVRKECTGLTDDYILVSKGGKIYKPTAYDGTGVIKGRLVENNQVVTKNN
jgi:hypothetical protein